MDPLVAQRIVEAADLRTQNLIALFVANCWPDDASSAIAREKRRMARAWLRVKARWDAEADRLIARGDRSGQLWAASRARTCQHHAAEWSRNST